MRHYRADEGASPGRGWIRGLLGTAALVAGLALPDVASAAGGGSTQGPGSVPGPDSGGDDETIGTLPIVGFGSPFDIVRRMREVRPAMYLEGSFDEVMNSLVGVDGHGQVSVDVLPGGNVRLAFHGRLELALDRALFESSDIQIGTSVPACYAGSQVWTGWAGQLSPSGVLPVGPVALPVQLLASRGGLDATPWLLAGRSSLFGNYRFQARADAGTVRLGQAY